MKRLWGNICRAMAACLARCHRQIVNLLFPSGCLCLGCRDPRKADPRYCLCPSCREKLLALRLREQLCPHCMSPLDSKGRCDFCRRDRLRALRAGYGAFYYRGIARKLILSLKFSFRNEAANALLTGLVRCFPAHEYDALVPVPLHPVRQRWRGVNQAEVLCRAISPRTGLPVLLALERPRATKPQSSLNIARRQKNVENAFRVALPVEGLRLLLVDDVRTTGATARACAKALNAAGAKYVSILTAAIAVRGE